MRSQGGAIIYIRNNISVDINTLLPYSHGQVELIFIHPRRMNFIIINCYCPPQCTFHFRAAMEKVTKIMEDQPAPIPEVILSVDFNFPFIH